MAFEVQIANSAEHYIRNCDRLSVFDQERIFAGIRDELGKSADKFFERNQFPQAPNLFWYDYTLMTEAIEVREFRFVCNADGHVYGVTEVLYAEEHPTDEDNES
jgi:hypothetical protein